MGGQVRKQVIAVRGFRKTATSATNQVGNEGIIFRFVAWHPITLAAIVGLIVLPYAYLFPHAIPHGLGILR